MELITESNHPIRQSLDGSTEESLSIRRTFVVMAINTWEANRYNAAPNRVEYNLNYFRVELAIIEKKIARFRGN